MKNHLQALKTLLDPLSRKYSLTILFNDFTTMGVCAFHRTNILTGLQIKDETNEALYLSVSEKYTPEELVSFSHALGVLQAAVYDRPYSDLLGDYYEENGLASQENGQLFTPEPVGNLMAKIQGENDKLEGKTVYDPACGSGRLLLAFAKAHYKNYFYGSELNETVAKMATINFFLNGLKGEVAWMNTLTMEWLGGWHINQNGLGVIPIEKENSQIWSKPLEPKAKPTTAPFDKNRIKPDHPGLQMDLF